VSGARVVVLFARVPEVGRVKSRLAAGVGDEAALEIYRYLGARVIDAVEATPSAWQTVVAGTPDWGELAIREWLGDEWRFVAQGAGDLGERMAAVFEAELARGAAAVVIVGTDCPEVDASVVAAAFDRLTMHDAVFGPATDGGYYLVGVAREAGARALPALFSEVPWSTAHTLSTSLARADAHGLSVALLGELADVDTAADWSSWLDRAPDVGEGVFDE
jgi:uncharacterized protein